MMLERIVAKAGLRLNRVVMGMGESIKDIVVYVGSLSR